MQTAKNVARWFLSRNNLRLVSGDAEYLSNLKLNRLLYYAQGVYLGFYDKKLFDEPILAWHYGPTVECIFEEYKANRARGIEEFELPIENFTSEEEQVLSFVEVNFGQFSAYKLNQMTTKETPWQETEQGQEIPVDKIKDYFLKNYIDEDAKDEA